MAAKKLMISGFLEYQTNQMVAACAECQCRILGRIVLFVGLHSHITSKMAMDT